MFVDYQIIRGDIWTRALSNEFMVVPASLQSSVIFKSMQVIFAVLIIHFLLKITGVYGRNVLVTTAFVFALVMIGCLGYLVAYNNMAGGTSATLEQPNTTTAPRQQNNSIDELFASNTAAPTAAPAAGHAGRGKDGGSRCRPAPAVADLAGHADSWFWLAFASVIFFIVTTVAALYMLTASRTTCAICTSRATTSTASASSRSSICCNWRTSGRASKLPVMQIMLALVTVAALAGGGLMAVRRGATMPRRW